MAYFYKDGSIHIGSAESQSRPVADLLPQPWQRPVYVYDLDDIEKRYRALDRALGSSPHAIHYAMKANSHPKILAHLARLGAGVDTVSAGEIRLALEAGMPPERIIFSGVAKTVAEIEFALKSKIKQINVESPQELERIASIARRLGCTANVAFRMNPDVNPQTHPYITTGFRENKFGMSESTIPDLVAILRSSEGALRLRGLTMHIGSLLFDIAVFKEAMDKIIRVHRQLVEAGFELDRLDIGGGLGIRYETGDDHADFELMDVYGKMVNQTFSALKAERPDRPLELITEPGRILVGRAGLLVTEVQYIKKTEQKTFAIVDTGMHHLLRPALYGAKHRLLALKAPATDARIKFDVVGPICESSDFFGKDVELPELRQGDLLGIADAGAYGYSMASRYNSHELPLEIVISQGTVCDVR